jgi:hypothetical protein
LSITTAARHISASNLSQRLGLDGPDDELRELMIFKRGGYGTSLRRIS